MNLFRMIIQNLLLIPLVFAACQTATKPLTPDEALIAKGKRLFADETFSGNGRTCATCHPVANNFTLDATFIATLPKDDPLFVAEFVPALKENFENPKLMREFGLIQENLDGFGDLRRRFTMRGIPHTLGLRTSIASPQGPRTGWSGDGAPGDGSLRSFATGAVIQHFTKTLNRVPGVDFRLPTDAELNALEAYQLSLGRQEELSLPLPLRGTVARRGQGIFLDDSLGKCNLCHINAGANAQFVKGKNLGNANFNTGVEDLPDQPARLAIPSTPRDDGFGSPGDGTFNIPPLVEAADTGPFFHNNAIETIEGAVGFYDGEAFNNSPAGRQLAAKDPKGVGIELDGTQIVAIASFLRVLNALENIRQSIGFLSQSREKGFYEYSGTRGLIQQALEETKDSIDVLADAGLHPLAVAELKEAHRFERKALRNLVLRRTFIRKAIEKQSRARDDLVERRNP